MGNRLKSLGSKVAGGGWATPTPPYITYPVQNVGWGEGERPPFDPATFIDRGRTMAVPPAPPPPAPAPPPAPLIPQEGPIPVEDWFNLLRR